MQDQAKHIAELIRQGKKLEAIKVLRETTGVDLKRAREEVDRLSAALAAQEVGLQPGEGGDVQWVEIEELARSGKKIEAIKRLRALTGMGLKEAKERVEAIEGVPSGGCAGVLLLLLLGGGALWTALAG